MPRGKDESKDKEIEEILVDTYGDDEAAAAWEVAFTDGVMLPFEATLLGDSVTVTNFRLSHCNAIQCHVRKQSRERWVGVADLDEDSLPEAILHVLDLYRYWNGGD